VAVTAGTILAMTVAGFQVNAVVEIHVTTRENYASA
jgi:hypothetical protein